jgi:hypothetical protein
MALGTWVAICMSPGYQGMFVKWKLDIRIKMMRYMLTIIAVVMLAGCGLIPEEVSSKYERLKPMFEAMRRTDRKSLGFTPVDPDASIRLEMGPRSGYDAMLHIDGRTSRTVAFKRLPSGYEWIGEQEIFSGPRKYKDEDGERNESITITYDKVPISGSPLNKTEITYYGENADLAWPHELSLDQVRPVLQQWGY